VVYLFVLVIALALSPLLAGVALALAIGFTSDRCHWRTAHALARAAPFFFGPELGGSMVFQAQAARLREEGRLSEAAALARACLADPKAPSWSRNVAIDVLISAGEYQAALGAELPARAPKNAPDASGLVLIQINLAEAEYNLGRWDAAEARLGPLDAAARRFPISRAGLLQQRAWIAAHRGRAAEALELCGRVKPRWLPAAYRAEYHFTRAAALLAAGQTDRAESALADAEALVKRASSRRNAFVLRARVAAARGDLAAVERLCREAASHPFSGQGGSGLLLWARTLEQLGRDGEALEAFRLVTLRDPESEAARAAAEALAAASHPA
jgi:tetratricopeptide (TPR) repeat protein